MSYAKHLPSNRAESTNQRTQTDPRQVENNSGGYVFEITSWQQLERFLILGTAGGTYYAGEREITLENAKNVLDCLKLDGKRTVETIVKFSDEGRAPKNDPAIFALALVLSDGDEETRKFAYQNVTKVCRIGTHLFQLVSALQTMKRRGWGRGLKRAISSWYLEKSPDNLAYQVLKYQNRNGWSHRDVLRLCHASSGNPKIDAILRWAVSGMSGMGERAIQRGENVKLYEAHRFELPSILSAYEDLKTLKEDKTVCQYIVDYGFTHEMIPTQFKNSSKVWEALLEKMPLTAMVRNLGKMTSLGMLNGDGENVQRVIENLTNEEKIRKSRIHPLNVLMALKVYEQGHGDKGSLTWRTNASIQNALNEAFYLSFRNVIPTGKRYLIGLDVSGSMSTDNIAGMPGITPRIASAAMAMMTLRSEESCLVHGFSSTFVPLGLTPDLKLNQVISKISNLPFARTDCAIPMVYAWKNKIPVDTFIVYTDNETYAGNIHPFQALKQYRQEMGIPAKLIVCGMTATKFTIADPNDPGMLDLVGCDSATPAIISAFSMYA